MNPRSFFSGSALSLSLLYVSADAMQAQTYPESVDIDLRRTEENNTQLEVYLRANGEAYGDLLSGLTFTLRWPTTSPAALGPRVNLCPDAIPISPTAPVIDPLVDGQPTGYNYRSYNAFSTAFLSDFGCTLPMDEWVLVMTVTVTGDTGCTDFVIMNDVYTGSEGQARDFYVSLGGYDKTGSILAEPVAVGDCDISTEVQEDAATMGSVSVAPVPTNGPLYWSLPADAPLTSTPVLNDVSGRVVRSFNSASIRSTNGVLSIAGMPSGVYVLELRSGERVWRERVVKE